MTKEIVVMSATDASNHMQQTGAAAVARVVQRQRVSVTNGKEKVTGLPNDPVGKRINLIHKKTTSRYSRRAVGALLH